MKHDIHIKLKFYELALLRKLIMLICDPNLVLDLCTTRRPKMRFL